MPATTTRQYVDPSDPSGRTSTTVCPVCRVDAGHDEDCPLVPCDTCGRGGFACECPDVCEHGSPAVESGSNSGFGGEGFSWVTYADGCTDADHGHVQP